MYDNGPINGTVTAWTINLGIAVSDSFTLSSATTLTGAQIGLWAFPGDTLTSVDWSIGNEAFGSEGGSGTASVGNAFQSTSLLGYSLLESTFSLTSVLGAGTYWLTLQNAVVPGGDPIFWDQNSGPSQAEEFGFGAIPSESFQLYGHQGAVVPEPSTLPILVSALPFLAGFVYLRRRMAKALQKAR